MSESLVYKFGGSSVRDAQAIQRCTQIVLNATHLKAVVVSATYQTTNQLEALFGCIEKSRHSEFDALLEQILGKHLSILDELGLNFQKNEFLNFLAPLLEGLKERRQKCDSSSSSLDEFYSLGEIMSSWIFHAYLYSKQVDCSWIDARVWLKTDSEFNHAKPDTNLIQKNVKTLKYQAKGIWVTQGFIGSDLDSRVTTLGREGSDYSATLLGEALGATQVVIWTDIDGIYSADPREVLGAQKINHLSYSQAEFLAESGAKVLYSQTLAPAKRAKFSVKVASSLAPEVLGSVIDSCEEAKFFAVTKKGYDEGHDLVTAIFLPQQASSLSKVVEDVKTLKSNSSCWQGVVPLSSSLLLMQNIHAALANSRV